MTERAEDMIRTGIGAHTSQSMSDVFSPSILSFEKIF